MAELYPAGSAVSDPQPGDFFLTHQAGIIPDLIRFGQKVRGIDARHRIYNHCGLFIDTSGAIIEALTSGVTLGNISRYQARDYTVFRLGQTADDHDRAQAVAFALSRLGDRYGWVTITSMVLSLLTGARVVFSREGTSICSGLVGRALERTSLIYHCDPGRLMPGDLSVLYGSTLPA